ncbi:hypothetical protein AYO45_04710 [Gammaproteobacteria bacterium SCGC AG-212-F23]|nr:hypothetical protein AYO45_04710 [Gammaproteobacteria bacterium SCGC AG-212-F23]
MRQLMMVLLVCLSSFAFAENPAMYTQEKPVVMVQRLQPEFVIQLKSNPTTGYSWFLRSYDANLLTPVKHVFQATSNKKLIGAPGYELWTFKVKPEAFSVPHQTEIQFVYQRPWEAAGAAGSKTVFKVVIK